MRIHAIRGLSEREYVEITTWAHLHAFAKNAALFIQGQPANTLILIESGTVKQTQVGRNGHEVLIRFTKIGDVVNLRAESAQLLYTCSAHAMEPCRALLWDYAHISG